MPIKTVIKILVLSVFLYFSYLMFLITWQYVPFNLNVSFLQLKDQLIEKHYQIAFFIHIYSSFFVLLVGFFQFFESIRKKNNNIHKALGYAYVLLVLVFASPSGFIMGIYGNGGFWSQISFCLQAVLWFSFTFYALKAILKNNYNLHFNLMLYSYALTFSAISLRLFKWLIVNLIELPPMDTYKIVVWLGWLFNLFIVLIYLKFYKLKDNKKKYKKKTDLFKNQSF